MGMKGRAASVLLMLPAFMAMTVSLAAQETTAVLRVYSLKHVPVTDIYPFVLPLLSPAGDLRIQPAQNLMQVKDIPERQRLVEKMIASLDIAPSSYRIAIKFIEASQAPPAGGVREEIAGIGQQLRGLIPFASYTVIEQLVVEGTPGDQISYRLGKDYLIEFKLQRLMQHPQIVQLSGLRLFRIKLLANGAERQLPVLRTSINLTLAQTHVLGASAMRTGSKALVMVFQAEKK